MLVLLPPRHSRNFIGNWTVENKYSRLNLHQRPSVQGSLFLVPAESPSIHFYFNLSTTTTDLCTMTTATKTRRNCQKKTLSTTARSGTAQREGLGNFSPPPLFFCKNKNKLNRKLFNKSNGVKNSKKTLIRK